MIVNICRSVVCAEIYFVNVFSLLDSKHEGWPILLVIVVLGFCPRGIWKVVVFSVLCGVCLIVLIANWTLCSNGNASSKLDHISDLIVPMVLYTNPVLLCNIGVHRIRSILSPSHSLNSLLLKGLPLSVPIIRRVSLSEHFLDKNFKPARVSVTLQKCAVGHWLKGSIATKVYKSPRVLDLIGPMKFNWISWFGLNKTPIFYFRARY